MNASNLIAWLLCLALAFVATALAGINRGKTIVLDRKLQEISDTREVSETQVEILKEIKTLLVRMGGNDPKSQEPAAERQALKARLKALEEKVDQLENRLPSGEEVRPSP